MKKLLLSIVLLLALVGNSVAQDPILRNWETLKTYLYAHFATVVNTNQTLVSPSMTTPVSADAIFLYNTYYTPGARSLTNGATLDLTTSTSAYMVLNGIGSADAGTNTVTVSQPIAAGQHVTLIIKNNTTNLIAIADAAPVALSAAWEGTADDVLELFARTATNWVEIGRSAN